MIVAYDIGGLLSYGETPAEAAQKAVEAWDCQRPLRVSFGVATPALGEAVAREGLSVRIGECKDGLIGVIGETPSGFVGRRPPSPLLPGQSEAPIKTFSRVGKE